MNEQELEIIVQQKLDAYEGQKAVMPAPEWKSVLQRRIRKPVKQNPLSASSAGLKILIMFITLINIIIIFSAVTKKQDTESGRKAELETIYNEILFNSNSSF